MSNETKVGIVVTIALIIMMGVTLFVTDIPWISGDGYTLNVIFRGYVSNVKKGAPVIFGGGVRIGKIRALKMYPEENAVKLVVQIQKDHKIRRGSRFFIASMGLMGDRYLNIESPPDKLQEGYYQPNEIIEGVSTFSIDMLGVKLSELVKDVFGTGTPDADVKKSFVQVFKNIGELAYYLDLIVKENRPIIKQTIESSADISARLKKISTELGEAFKKDEIRKINKTVENLNKVSENLADITSAIRDRQGAIGVLIYDKKAGDSIRNTLRNLELFSEKLKRASGPFAW